MLDMIYICETADTRQAHVVYNCYDAYYVNEIIDFEQIFWMQIKNLQNLQSYFIFLWQTALHKKQYKSNMNKNIQGNDCI